MKFNKVIQYSYVITNTTVAIYATYLLGQRIPSTEIGHGLSIYFLAIFPLLLFSFIELLYIEETENHASSRISKLWIAQILGVALTALFGWNTITEILLLYGLLQYFSTLIWGLSHQILIPAYTALKSRHTLDSTTLFEQMIPWGIALAPNIICAGLAISLLLREDIISYTSLVTLSITTLLQSRDAIESQRG